VVSDDAIAFQRKLGEETTLVVINYGAGRTQVKVDGLPANASLQPAYPAGAKALAADANGKSGISIGAQSVMVFAVMPMQ
jgi:hypothetical protein